MSYKKLKLDQKGQMQISGAEELAETLTKVKQAAEASPAIVARLNAIAEANKSVAQQAGQAAVAQEKAAKSAKMLEQAKGVGELAKQAAELGGKMRKAGEEIARVDPELGAFVEESGKAAEAVGQVGMAIATGFAVGGPPGAAIAGITVAVGKLIESFVDAAAEMKRMEAQTNAAFDQFLEKQKQLGAEAGAARWKAWVEGIDDATKAVVRQNEELARSVELIREKRQAAAQMANDKDEVELARIEADPKRTEEQKIADGDKVRARMSQRAKQGELAELKDREENSKIQKDSARRELEQAEKNLSELHETKKKLEERQKEIANQERMIAHDQATLKQTQESLAEFPKDFAKNAAISAIKTAISIPPWLGGGSAEDALRYKNLKEQEEALMGKPSQLPKHVKEEQGGLEKLISGADAKIAAEAARVEDLQQEYSAQRAQHEQVKAINAYQAPAIESRYAKSNEIHAIESATQMQEARRNSSHESAQIGFEAANLARGIDAGMASEVEKLAGNLERNPSGEDRVRLERALEKLLSVVESSMGKGDQLFKNLEMLEKKVEALNNQMRNSRSSMGR